MSPSKSWIFLLIVIFSIPKNASENSCLYYEKLCNEESKSTCEECKSVHPCCVWLSDKQINDSKRCTIEEKLSATNYKGNYLIGGPSKVAILENKDFYEPSFSNDEPAIQIRPQKMQLSVRRGENVTFELKYKAAQDYPLDLYYLMDQTFSMRNHIKQVASLGEDLSKKMFALSENFKIAFGSFSDKLAMPFVSMLPQELANPCLRIPEIGSCIPGFDFVHFLNFTESVGNFVDKVRNSSYTANIDDLEGGLDAILQIILCQDQLHWRKHSRKLILVATDGLLHSAGSGILGGIVGRSSKKCQLVFDAHRKVLLYDGLQFDYPSFEEINMQLLKHKINILFLVTEKYERFYQGIRELMPQVNNYGLLDDNSENILELIEMGYKTLVQQVAFKVQTENPNLKVSFQSTCNTDEIHETNVCSNVKMEEEYVFKVTVQFAGDLEDLPEEKQILRIEEMNIKEFLEIEIDFVEKCNCNDENENSQSQHGKNKCGILICDPGWGGEDCSKKCTREMGRLINESYTSATCFNRGDFDEISCECICDPDFSGTYCEHHQCPRDNKGQICSGHGACIAGECVCTEGYTGPLCDCTTRTDTCTAPGDTVPCNGMGDCICGRCKCHDYIDRKHLCAFCKQCKHYCDLYDKTVEQLAQNLPVEQAVEAEKSTTALEDPQCLVTFNSEDDIWCQVEYTYSLGNLTSIVYYKRCQRVVTRAQVIGVISSCVIGIGIICLLVYKGVIFFREKREYAKFKQVVEFTEYREENALYKSPLRTYRNPANNSNL